MNRFLDIRSYLTQVGFAFRALQSRNFRSFFWGQSVSLTGTWIQNLAVGWLVYRLTESAFWLGAIGFAGQIPSLLITPFAGVYADRSNRRKVLLITQIASMILALLLAYFAFSNQITLWHLLVIASLNGCLMAIDTPFRHAFLLELVGDKSLLQNAVAMNATLINAARFVGPSIGGFFIALLGERWCFLLNGLSFLAIIVALARMNIVCTPVQGNGNSVLTDLREGLRYAFGNSDIRDLLGLVTMISFLGLPFQVFLPVYARDILHGDSTLLGFLTGAFGMGALGGAFYLTSVRQVEGLPVKISIATTILSVGLMGFSHSGITSLSLVLLFVSGFGMIFSFAATNTLLQTITEQSKRGRVLSLYGMTFMGITPLGSLLMGSMTTFWGEPLTLLLCGGVCLIVAIVFFRKSGTITQHIAAHTVGQG